MYIIGIIEIEKLNILGPQVAIKNIGILSFISGSSGTFFEKWPLCLPLCSRFEEKGRNYSIGWYL